jgi:hypothetical protein
MVNKYDDQVSWLSMMIKYDDQVSWLIKYDDWLSMVID